jgi:hypothetical protein
MGRRYGRTQRAALIAIAPCGSQRAVDLKPCGVRSVASVDVTRVPKLAPRCDCYWTTTPKFSFFSDATAAKRKKSTPEWFAVRLVRLRTGATDRRVVEGQAKHVWRDPGVGSSRAARFGADRSSVGEGRGRARPRYRRLPSQKRITSVDFPFSGCQRTNDLRRRGGRITHHFE